MPDDDRTLLQKIIAGDAEAAVYLFTVHCAGIFRYLAAYYDNPAHFSADDLCHEVFLILSADNFRVLRQFRFKCTLKSYIATIATNFLTQQKIKNLAFFPLFDTAKQAHLPAETPVLERAQELYKIYQQWPASREKQILEECVLLNKKPALVARAMNMTSTEFHRVFTHARNHLRREYHAYLLRKHPRPLRANHRTRRQ